MHFEVLIEDKSGKIMLEKLLPKIIDESEGHTYSIRPYGGTGRIPKNLRSGSDYKKQALLNDLPRILSGFGKTFRGYGTSYPACVIVICDLDSRCFREFRQELYGLLEKCDPAPETRFCLAIEEGEAWLLGDINAILQAYPRANRSILNSYINDSICGTWEYLKKAIAPNDNAANKSEWAENITPHMNINQNQSPSFRYFVSKVNQLVRAN